MASNKKIAQLMKLVEKIQTSTHEGKKMMELIAVILQTVMKNAPKEKGEKPHNVGGEDDKKKEEKEEKRTPQIDP